MGFLDALLGGQRKLKAPAADRLFAMTTAYVTIETSLGMTSGGRAGIVFQPLATPDFKSILAETEELLHGAASDSGTTVSSHDDEFRYRWLILADPDFDDLVISVNTVSAQLQSGGYGDRLLCAVFKLIEGDDAVYVIYNFKRGAFYPFVPTGKGTRNDERELQLVAQLGAELPFEQEIDRRLPLWEIPL